MKYGFKIREEEQSILFTSNKELLYPKIQSIASKQMVVKGDLQQYSSVMVNLLNILEELEKLLSEKRIKHKYVLVNDEDIVLFS
jgi:hypothetical protein